MRIGIVVSDFNSEITEMMEKVAEEIAQSKKVGAEIIHVPGVFDIPLAVKRLLKKKEIKGVATLGAVIQGDTDHDIIITQAAAQKIAGLSLEFEKPVTLGIIGPRVSWEEADKRKEEYANRAVNACLKMIDAIK